MNVRSQLFVGTENPLQKGISVHGGRSFRTISCAAFHFPTYRPVSVAHKLSRIG
jgi:hypothetical protein